MATSRKGTQTKSNIITTAKILFYENGYNKTGIQDIADRADVKLGTITYYYKKKDDMNSFKLYIARDEGKWDEDVQTTGELNLFYDTPQLLFNVKYWTSYWGNARKIAHIPSYMYPQIKDKECYVFNNLELYQSFN